MKIYFKDFIPEIAVQKKVLMMTFSDHEGVSEVLPELNLWIAKHAIDVVNVETVLLPNVNSGAGSNDASLRSSGDFNNWLQVVRVWYRLEDGQPMPMG